MGSFHRRSRREDSLRNRPLRHLQKDARRREAASGQWDRWRRDGFSRRRVLISSFKTLKPYVEVCDFHACMYRERERVCVCVQATYLFFFVSISSTPKSTMIEYTPNKNRSIMIFYINTPPHPSAQIRTQQLTQQENSPRERKKEGRRR